MSGVNDTIADLMVRMRNGLTARKKTVDVPASRRFLGFDAFKQAMDCLRPGTGDIAMLTTRAAFHRFRQTCGKAAA